MKTDEADAILVQLPVADITPDGIMAVIEAMRTRGFGLTLDVWPEGDAAAEFRRNPVGRPSYCRVSCLALGDAVILAATRRLRVEAVE